MRRGGFASFTAVVMLAVVASAITASTAFLATQWRRSQRADAEAQLRQYLLAGEVYAAGLLRGGEASVDAPLPTGGTLRVERVEPLRARVTVEHAGRRVAQELVYERDGEALRLREAALGASAAAGTP